MNMFTFYNLDVPNFSRKDRIFFLFNGFFRILPLFYMQIHMIALGYWS